MNATDVDWKSVLRWSLRGLLVLALLLLAGSGYVVYRTVWGTPLRFSDLLMRQAADYVLERPQLLTQIGILDGAWYDFSSGKLDPYSLAERRRRFAQLRRFEAELAAWDRSGLSEEDKLSYDTVHWSNVRALADEKYPWLGADNKPYPVEPVFGVQKELPFFLLTVHQIKNERLARHYVERLKALGSIIDAVRLDVERQAREGVIAPDFVIDASVVQMKALIAPMPGKNPLVTHLANRTAAIGLDGAARNRLIDGAVAALNESVYPAYRRLIAEQEALRTRATHEAGIWRLKGGSAYYADQLQTLTSTDLTPDRIHALGLREVARLTAEADGVLESTGLSQGSVGERFARLMADPRFLYPDTEVGRAAQLARYRQILGRMQHLLPKAFAVMPKMALVVRGAPADLEAQLPPGHYERGTLDGSRPGVFYVNLRNPAVTPMWAMPTLAYHEGIPGHHLQFAVAAANGDLPPQRRLAYFPAYSEGWGLYAEYLAKEMGLYAGDPYGDLGRLRSELLRAARLVADTGIHAKRWSREEAIAYLQETTGIPAREAASEVDRYTVWPGQACVYTVGLMTILELREKAQRTLGPRFDLKDFHAAVLNEGAMPLWLLRHSIDGWIAEKLAITATAVPR